MRKAFLIFFTAIFGIIYNMIGFNLSSSINISIILILLYCAVWKDNRENFGDGEYDYDVENPNALVSGRQVAGTVYASNQTAGLGWIL